MSSSYPALTLVRNRAYHVAMDLRRRYLRRVWGITIGEGSRVSLSAKLDKTNPKGVVIGDWTVVTFGASILTHDFVRRRHLTTTIGSNVFIGARAVVMPGVTIGDGCIVSALSLVARDVPAGSVVMGNPARVVQKGQRLGHFGGPADDPSHLLPPEPPVESAPAASPPAASPPAVSTDAVSPSAESQEPT